MARVMEDSESDDEFPDLQELVERRGLGVKSVAARSTGNDERGVGKAESPVKRKARRDEIKEKEKGCGEVGKPKPRKRILNQKSDNPLLRPLSGASSELVGEGSKRKGRAMSVKEVRKMSRNGSKILASNYEQQNEETRESQAERTKERRAAEESRSKPIQPIETEEGVLEEVTRSKNERGTAKSKQVRKTVEKTRSKATPKFESDEDFGLDSDGLSDFIVDDSTFLEEEDTIIEAPPPRSVRRFVKGRKPTRNEVSDDEDLGLRMGILKLSVEDDPSTSLEKALKGLDLEDSGDMFSDNEEVLEPKPKKSLKIKAPKQPKNEGEKKASPSNSDVEDPFTLR
jgi:hypothetical protein